MPYHRGNLTVKQALTLALSQRARDYIQERPHTVWSVRVVFDRVSLVWFG
jgi:hypothetical protein